MADSCDALYQLLEAHEKGDPEALDQLVALLYTDLKRLAHFELGRLRPYETLNTTGLVHETYLKIAQRRPAGWEGRAHFLGAAAKAMRHILVDAARRRLSQKQGGGQRPEPLDERLCAEGNHAERVLAIDQALEGLRALDERMGQVVECQFFGGYTKEETAEVLGVSVRTVHRDWIRARGWLRQRLGATGC
jgi:RNA polymerase sigma factor (TIGR02999 family)